MWSTWLLLVGAVAVETTLMVEALVVVVREVCLLDFLA
jgi:hypothetical protein